VLAAVGVIISTLVPRIRIALGSLALTIVFSAALLYMTEVKPVSLFIFVLLSSSLLLLARNNSASDQLLPSNPMAGFLTWIVLGSLLLIFAAVLKNTRWQALRLESLPDWSEIWSQYGIVLILVGLTIMATLLWYKTDRADSK
jgi:uncharacterized membrane protein YidH (DUF202 family)